MLILKGHTNSVQALAYTPDGQTLISAGDDCTIRLWDVRTAREVACLRDHTDAILSLSVSQDGRLLASGGHDKRVRLWDFEELRVVETYKRFEASVNAVSLSPDGRFLASGADRSQGETLRVRNLPSARQWAVAGGPTRMRAVWSLALSADSGWLAVGRGDGVVELHDPMFVASIHLLAHSSGVTAMAFAPDGGTLATLSANTVTLWDVEQGQRRRTVGEHPGRAWSLAHTPDGRYIATGGWDSTVRLWDPITGRERARFDWHLGRVNAVAFSPDGMTAAAAGNAHDIVIWDVDDL
jgi:WD40 repeat protein